MLAGDTAAAERVELELPETGVCSTAKLVGSGGCCGEALPARALVATAAATPIGAVDAAGCCGGPAPAGVDACCVDDADAKAVGQSGCGCGSPEPVLITIGKRFEPSTRGVR
jgi:hypothetical protein